MGHVSPETTARYVHLSVEQLAAEYGAARATLGGSTAMTAAALGCGVGADALLGDYLDHVAGLGLGERAVRDRTRIAREFLSRNPDLRRVDEPACRRAGR